MAEKEHYDFVEVTSADILADRRGGWEGFTRFVTWGTGATVLVLVLMAIFLVRRRALFSMKKGRL